MRVQWSMPHDVLAVSEALQQYHLGRADVPPARLQEALLALGDVKVAIERGSRHEHCGLYLSIGSDSRSGGRKIRPPFLQGYVNSTEHRVR